MRLRFLLPCALLLAACQLPTDAVLRETARTNADQFVATWTPVANGYLQFEFDVEVTITNASALPLELERCGDGQLLFGVAREDGLAHGWQQVVGCPASENLVMAPQSSVQQTLRVYGTSWYGVEQTGPPMHGAHRLLFLTPKGPLRSNAFEIVPLL